MQGDAIGGLGGSQLGGLRREALAQIPKACRKGLRDEVFIEAKVVPRHSHRIVFGIRGIEGHFTPIPSDG
jgi:hypothetical protein